MTHYVVMGKPSSEKIIFLHGWGGSTESFFMLATQMRTQNPNLEIILVDYPGFGLSGFPPATGFNSHDYAEWLYDFMTLLNIPKANFYAHSNGGRILVDLIENHPHAVQKCIFSCTAGVKVPEGFKQKIAAKLKFINKFLPERIRKFILVKILGARDWAEVKDGNKATLTKILAEPDITPKLQKIEHQSLILWGKKDTMTPFSPCGETYIKSLKNSTSIIFENGRHGIHYTHKNQIIKAVIDFLKI